MKTYRECPLCTSAQIQPHLRCKDHTASGKMFDLYRCGTCGFLFTQDIPDENEIGEYYQSAGYLPHASGAAGLLATAYRLVRRIALRQKKNLVCRTAGRSRGTLLDIGCGTGEFLHTMKKAGWDVKGVEPSEAARQHAKTRYDLDVSPPSDLPELPDASFDVITMWHSLEHVQDLRGYLTKIRSLLNAKGLLLVAVPNADSFDASHYREFWAAYEVPRHLHHFTPATMKQWLDKYGLHLETMMGMPFDAYYISLLSEKYRSGKRNFWRVFLMGRDFNNRAKDHPERCSSIIYIAHK